MYEENERAISLNTAKNLGLNPIALKKTLEMYKKTHAPKPAHIKINIKPDAKVVLGKLEEAVDIYMSTPGYLGRATTLNINKADPRDVACLKLLCGSYFIHVRPYPIGFFMDGVEIHIRTPGVDDTKDKNIARNIFNEGK